MIWEKLFQFQDSQMCGNITQSNSVCWLIGASTKKMKWRHFHVFHACNNERSDTSLSYALMYTCPKGELRDNVQGTKYSISSLSIIVFVFYKINLYKISSIKSTTIHDSLSKRLIIYHNKWINIYIIKNDYFRFGHPVVFC